MNNAPAWLNNAIVKGLQDLFLLQLDRAPAADNLELVVERWVFILWQNNKGMEKTDKARIERAFIKLSANIDRWPTPHQLMQYMPRKKQPEYDDSVINKADARKAFAQLRKEMNL